MSDVARALGLDVGMKTIGVALADALGLAAHPLEVIERRGIEVDVARLIALIDEHGSRAVVAGLPLELSGREGPRVARVRKLLAALAEGLGDRDVAIHEWDERFSTTAAERVLIDADVSRRRRKQVIDKQAAAYILQGWLESRRSSGEPDSSPT
jgi:putative Holliday junction resolvase